MWFLSSFYVFVSLDDPPRVAANLRAFSQARGLRGLVILAKEGFNAGLAAPNPEALAEAKSLFREIAAGAPLDEKDSTHEKAPYQGFQIKLRDEIVSLGRPDLLPTPTARKLSPEEWDQAIDGGAILLDTRNTYESRIGSFPGAIKPALRAFSEFPEAVRQANLPKDRPILIFCTGGIRCEKAAAALNEQGYERVYQLDGGILRYLEKTGGGRWDGECFVFDHRVAVTRELEPTSRFGLCPLCGQAAEHEVRCLHCARPTRLCPECRDLGVCSKNCRHHHHELKRPPRRFD